MVSTMAVSMGWWEICRKSAAIDPKYQIRRPLPTAGGARQRRDYKQQVLCSASEGQARGDRKGSQVQSKKPKKGSEKGGAVSANVAGQARGGQKGKPGAE